jgi:molecular chaperone GrpE
MTKDKTQKSGPSVLAEETGNNLDNSQELSELKNKCEEYLSGWQRAKADYLNLKRETEERHETLAEFVQAGLIMEIIPIINNLKKALTFIPDDLKETAWAKGFCHIAKQFEDILKKLDIEEIKTVGEQFNPEFHEAVASEEKPDLDDQTIITELTPGYKMNDKVITPAKVTVNVRNKD